jgi:hypothetical protein
MHSVHLSTPGCAPAQAAPLASIQVRLRIQSILLTTACFLFGALALIDSASLPGL